MDHQVLVAAMHFAASVLESRSRNLFPTTRYTALVRDLREGIPPLSFAKHYRPSPIKGQTSRAQRRINPARIDNISRCIIQIFSVASPTLSADGVEGLRGGGGKTSSMAGTRGIFARVANDVCLLFDTQNARKSQRRVIAGQITRPIIPGHAILSDN